jgi:hypothetical protein
MTSLNWKGYIKNIRDNKANFIKDNLKLVGSCLEVGEGDDFNIRTLSWKKFTICDSYIKPHKKNKIVNVDSDSNKRGKYIRSYIYPIQKPSIIKKSDLICVSSLSFYDEIITKLKKNNQIISLNEI